MSPLPKRQDYKFTKNLEYAERDFGVIYRLDKIRFRSQWNLSVLQKLAFVREPLNSRESQGEVV